MEEEEGAKRADIEIGGDLSTLSLEDLDERVALLEAEIERLKEERKRKAGSLAAADAFFKPSKQS